MTEFCPLPLDTVTKRRFWESLDNRSLAAGRVRETKCCRCDKPVSVNVIGLNKRLLGRYISRFMCLDYPC